MTAKYAYYPGCSLHSTGSEYDVSFRAVCNKAGIDIEEVKGWVCCGTSPAHCSAKLLSLALPYGNLCQAEKMGASDVVAPCAACFARFKNAKYELDKDPELLKEINNIISQTFENKVKILQ